MSARDYARWRVGDGSAAPPPHERQMAIIEIDRSLKVLFSEAEGGVAWLRRPRSAFENRSALEAMLDAGEGLSRVQATLTELPAGLKGGLSET